MISKITLQNFKVFKLKTTFEFSKINLLTGINGRGKSSLLQSMLLFKQSIAADANTSVLILNGTSVQLGKFGDIKNIESKNENTIDIGFTFTNSNIDTTIDVNYQLSEDPNDDVVLLVQSCSVKSSNLLINPQAQFTTQEIHIFYDKAQQKYKEQWSEQENHVFNSPDNILHRFAFLKLASGERLDSYFNLNKRFHYIAADRLGPQIFYEKTPLQPFISVDKQGHNVASIISAKRSQTVSTKLCIQTENYKEVEMQDIAATLLTQIGNWIGFITDTQKVQLNIGKDSNSYIITLEFQFNGQPPFKPANIGFGYSYILPIVVSGLIAKENEILIVENPEAHLHPRAQSRLSHFLAKVASTGIQVFIESHSEHILNALRVASLESDSGLNNKDVKIFYFQDKENEPFVSLNIEKDGKIKNWVNGFFDQQEIDLANIFRMGRTKK